jgi:hypothetical protein
LGLRGRSLFDFLGQAIVILGVERGARWLIFWKGDRDIEELRERSLFYFS